MKPEDIEIKIKKDEAGPGSSSSDATANDPNATTPAVPEDSNSIVDRAMKQMEETKKLQEIK